MTDKWLLHRLFDSSKQSVPRFAFQSTINWMAALAILCTKNEFESHELKKYYKSVNRRNVNTKSDTWVFENVLMAIHNVSALVEMSTNSLSHTAIIRSAIIAWYYSIYYSSSSMVAAASGSKQETHTTTGKVWHADIVQNKLAVGVFGLSLESLVKKDVKKHIKQLRNGNDFLLKEKATNEIDAWGAACSYLSGTADREKGLVEDRVRNDKEFKSQGFTNFRTTAAQILRDAQLKKKGVNFLTQSFRYRGKANYRDSIYLSYGEDRAGSMADFVNKLYTVSETYLVMACHYASKRVEKGSWVKFIEDLDHNLKIKFNIERIACE